MKSVKVLVLIIVSVLIASSVVFAENKNQDYAVPALADMPMFNLPTTNLPQKLSTQELKENINPFPTAEQLKWFDVNRDLQINNFDVKQFESIVKNLRGEKMSGIQLTIRFRVAQKNQKDSFPILYDLDRDGMFTPYDVDYFSSIISKLDQGASRGNELIEKFKLQLLAKK